MSEKITFYCDEDLAIALDEKRLDLRKNHSINADRGAVVRAALEIAFKDFEKRGEESSLKKILTK